MNTMYVYRIIIGGSRGSRPDMMNSSVTVMPYMMEAGEEKIIANAIYDATGVRLRRVPFRKERVLAALNAARV